VKLIMMRLKESGSKSRSRDGGMYMVSVDSIMAIASTSFCEATIDHYAKSDNQITIYMLFIR
jgi:hypothetical protein